MLMLQEFPQLSPLILRKFKQPGDVETALNLVFRSRGIERTRELAAEHARLAAQAVSMAAAFAMIFLIGA